MHFNLKNYSSKAEVLAAVDAIEYIGENTNTTGGLKVARLEVFDPLYAQRPGVDRIIVLMTDGVPTYDADKLADEVAAVKRMGVRILGLGVTSKVILFLFFVRRSPLSIIFTFATFSKHSCLNVGLEAIRVAVGIYFNNRVTNFAFCLTFQYILCVS